MLRLILVRSRPTLLLLSGRDCRHKDCTLQPQTQVAAETREAPEFRDGHLRSSSLSGMTSPLAKKWRKILADAPTYDLTDLTDSDEDTEARRSTDSRPPAAAKVTVKPQASGDADARARQKIMDHAANANAHGNRLLAELEAARRSRQAPGRSGTASKTAPASTSAAAVGIHEGHQPQPAAQRPTLSLLTYNLWFNEDVAAAERMAAIARLVEGLGLPDFICFQEMTQYFYALLSTASWWARYESTPCRMNVRYFTTLMRRTDTSTSLAGFQISPFANSSMGRDLTSKAVEVAGRALRVATSHLESPIGWKWNEKKSEERQVQCQQGLQQLDEVAEPNCIWAGDMNWNDKPKGDGDVPLPSNWQDAWAVLRPRDPGYTYDGRANKMLSNSLRSRLDRVFVKLRDWRLDSIKLVGTEGLPGLTYEKETSKKQMTVPVYPSDHFGLYVTLEPL